MGNIIEFVFKLVLFCIIFLCIFWWFMRRSEGEVGNKEIEWVGGKVKRIYKKVKEIKIIKEEKKVVIKEEIENYDNNILLLYFFIVL